jgi:NADH-quinone oxidoreductase subunit H
MAEAIELIFYYLVFPGLAFCTILGLVLSFIDRKVSAMVQWRVGPGPGQPFFDVVKLLGKETVVPEESWARGFLAAPYVAFGAAGLAATIVWLAVLRIGGSPPGDLIVVLYLLSIPAIAVIVGGAASGNPLGAVGASREVKLVMAYELPFVAALLAVVFQTEDGATLSLSGLVALQDQAGSAMGRVSGVLGFIAALLCCQAKLGLVPFDMAEAECEIGEGALIEYSGPALGFFKLTQAVQLATLPALLVVVFWGGMGPGPAGVAVFALKVLLIVTVFVLVKNTNPRARIDQALRFFWGPVTALAFAALALAVLGV